MKLKCFPKICLRSHSLYMRALRGHGQCLFLWASLFGCNVDHLSTSGSVLKKNIVPVIIYTWWNMWYFCAIGAQKDMGLRGLLWTWRPCMMGVALVAISGDINCNFHVGALNHCVSRIRGARNNVKNLFKICLELWSCKLLHFSVAAWHGWKVSLQMELHVIS